MTVGPVTVKQGNPQAAHTAGARRGSPPGAAPGEQVVSGSGTFLSPPRAALTSCPAPTGDCTTNVDRSIGRSTPSGGAEPVSRANAPPPRPSAMTSRPGSGSCSPNSGSRSTTRRPQAESDEHPTVASGGSARPDPGPRPEPAPARPWPPSKCWLPTAPSERREGFGFWGSRADARRGVSPARPATERGPGNFAGASELTRIGPSFHFGERAVCVP